ncbi:hypothetical protein MLD38_008631 [Melastoma candidum]|uniref:Uncharacterized protein n=1 Tax=Melastoma candidum TaxID=119954 RepID=A0ACB9RY13_9MYRT|nr:hypothetical protein MLD38_008631 [Melastoma candidum]
MGLKKGCRRSDESGNGKERDCGELLAQSGGSVDLNGQEGREREKKRKVVDFDGKDHDDGCDLRMAEEEERSKEAKEKNRRKNNIDVDEQQSERGDVDIGSSGSDIIQRTKEEG